VEKIENIAANFMVSQGVYETMANSLTKPDYIENSEMLHSAQNVTMLNALSNDLSVMRQSMLFGNLEAVAYNLNRKNNDLKFFEFGNTYHKNETGYNENKHLSITITGNQNASNWSSPENKSNVFYLKGIVKALLNRLGIANIKYVATDNDLFSDAIAIQIGASKLVEFGIVKSSILKKFGIKQEVLFADFDWTLVLQHLGKKQIKVKALPKYPEVKRDLALLLDQSVKFIDLYQAAFQTEKKLLKEVDLFDVYEGDKIPKGKISYALSFVLQDENKTLTDNQIDKIMQKLQNTFTNQFGAQLR
jgi:phenylalanyl-tRNA synthetase beta chain